MIKIKVVYIMKKLLIISLVAVLLAGCSGENGELVGVYNKSWKEPVPYGMLYIKRGSFTMGQNDQDANWAMTSQSRTVSVMHSGWMRQRSPMVSTNNSLNG